MEKRGQVAIFILFSLVILISALLVYYLRSSEPAEVSKITEADFNVAPIKSYVDTCIKDLGEDALILLGFQGGNLEDIDTETNILLIRKFFEEGKSKVPPKEYLESSYSRYLESKLPSCLSNANFQGYELSLGNVSVNAKFYDEFVDVKIDFPLAIVKDSSKIQLESFDKKYPIRMGHIHGISAKLVEKFVENPDRIDYSYFMQFKDDNFFIIPYSEDYFIIAIEDEKSKIQDKNYQFMFGLIFSGKEENQAKEEMQRLLA